jgi:protein regulator of cytokinesis 1
MLQNLWQEKLSAAKYNVLIYNVNKLRDEIRFWWDKCFVGDKERQNFESYHSTDYTPELLNQHEEKLDQLKRNFHTHK